jgi:DNA-binding HxlR family transcriptional regulator
MLKEQILLFLLERGSASWNELLALGLSKGGLSKALNLLLQEGLVLRHVKTDRKPPQVFYQLTQKGLVAAEDLIAEKETKIEAVAEGSNLIEFYERRFARRLVHLELWRYKVTPAKTLVSLNFYPAYVFVKAIVHPGEKSRKFNVFLGSLYVKSVDEKARNVDEMLLKKGYNPCFTEALWKACSPKVWRKVDGEEPLPGYKFNFVHAYNDLLSEEIKSILMEAYPQSSREEELRGRVFATLKVISHPIRERRKIIRELWDGFTPQ